MQILRLNDVKLKTGLSRSSIYRLISLKKFPKQIKLGERTAGWIEDEVDAWLTSKKEDRDKNTNP